jgi:hypothetical protein
VYTFSRSLGRRTSAAGGKGTGSTPCEDRDLWFRVRGFGFWALVQSSEFRVQGTTFKV